MSYQSLYINQFPSENNSNFPTIFPQIFFPEHLWFELDTLYTLARNDRRVKWLGSNRWEPTQAPTQQHTCGGFACVGANVAMRCLNGRVVPDESAKSRGTREKCSHQARPEPGASVGDEDHSGEQVLAHALMCWCIGKEKIAEWNSSMDLDEDYRAGSILTMEP